jgi:allantoinase
MAQGESDSLRQAANADSGSDTWKSKLTWAFRSTRVLTPDGLQPAAVLVRAGRIVDVVSWEDVPADAHLRDYADYVLMPGLVDTHVHINDAGDAGCSAGSGRSQWEGFPTATQAAAAGGITTLVDMPLNCVPETLSLASLAAKRSAAGSPVSNQPSDLSAHASRAWVDWTTWGGLVGNSGVGGNEVELQNLIEAGLPGFKCFLVNSGIDTFAWVDEAQLRKGLAVLRNTGLPLLAHAELAGPVDRATALLNSAEETDWRSYATYLASRPDDAELQAIELLIGLAVIFETPLHIVHLATARALPILKKARQAGLKITVETCPHYLWFAAEDIPEGATEYKCAPPIRSAANREALWEGLDDGTIDLIASDHSPCPPELKHREAGHFDLAWGGIASLGLALPVIWTALLKRRSERQLERPIGGLELIARWMATEPARLAGLAGRKGALAAGCDADLVVFDPKAEWTVTPQDLWFRHKLSPYVGATLRGRVLETYLRGECIFWTRGNGGMMDPKAHGMEIRRTA